MALLIDSIRTWLASLDPDLLYWAGASMLACAVVTNLAWLLRSRFRLPLLLRDALVQVARFLFYLGVPYLALGGWPRPPFHGLLSLEELGLVGANPRWPATRWLGAAGTGIWMGLAAFFLLLLAWKSANRGTVRLGLPPRPWWALLIDGFYLQVHWAFYRAALAAALGDPSIGAFGGLGLVYVEWALDPAWRQGWREQAQVAERWLRAALALVAAILFFLTHNLWICLGLHWVLDIAMRGVARSGDRPQPEGVARSGAGHSPRE
jgi:hypothetical protein